MIFTQSSNPTTQLGVEKLTANPPILKHMMGYGLPGGLIAGFAGFRLLKAHTESLLLANGTLSLAEFNQILRLEFIGLILFMIPVLLLFRTQWVAPSWKAKFAHSFAVGFVVTLIAGVAFNLVNGAFYNRELWYVLQPGFVPDDSVFLPKLNQTVWNTVVEGAAFLGGLLAIIPLASGFLGMLLLRRNPEQDLPRIKDGFGSVAAVIIPVMLMFYLVINMTIFVVLPDVMKDLAIEHSQTLNTDMVLAASTVPLFVMIIIMQVLSLVWLITAKPEMMHRMLLKIAAYIQIILPVFFIAFQAFVRPIVLSPLELVTVYAPYTILAWSFSVIAFIKLRKFNPKRDNQTRASIVSLWSLSLSTFILVCLMGIYLVVSTPVNVVLYSVVFIPEAMEPTQSITIQEIMNPLTYDYWNTVSMVFIIAVLTYCIPSTVILWGINRFEK